MVARLVFKGKAVLRSRSECISFVFLFLLLVMTALVRELLGLALRGWGWAALRVKAAGLRRRGPADWFQALRPEAGAPTPTRTWSPGELESDSPSSLSMWSLNSSTGEFWEGVTSFPHSTGCTACGVLVGKMERSGGW